MAASAKSLKARLKQDEDRYADSTLLRLHRALSWLARAEAAAGDPDAVFLFLWVAFNAAYAHEFDGNENERVRLDAYIGQLVAVDAERALHAIAFRQFSGPIRLLIHNKFVYQPFWRALQEHDASDRWKRSFEGSSKAALASIVSGDTARVLSIVFDRLYVLRNQLVHGGATWNSSVNRAQLRDGVRILSALLPAMLKLVLDHPELDFGDVLYPVVR